MAQNRAGFYFFATKDQSLLGQTLVASARAMVSTRPQNCVFHLLLRTIKGQPHERDFVSLQNTHYCSYYMAIKEAHQPLVLPFGACSFFCLASKQRP